MDTSMSVLFTRIESEFRKFRSNPYQWFVLVGDRLVVAGALTVVFSLGVVILIHTDIVAVTETTQLLYLFQGLIAGNLTLITIVLSINQLVLSREFNTPGELEDRIENAISYRKSIAETMNEPTVPVTPARFLAVLLDGARENAQRLSGGIEGSNSDQLADDVDSLVSEITSHNDHISDVLSRSQGGIFSALAVTLETNYSHQLNEAFRMQAVYGDELSSTDQELLDELIQSLKQIDIARQYFKSIYMQSELARLSRILLYVGVPAVMSAILLLLIYASAPEPPIRIEHLKLIVPVVVILGFVPLAVLCSFVLRIAMVAQRTVAITPFTTPTQEAGFDTR